MQWYHYLFCSYTLNSLSVSRIHYEFTVCFANSPWIHCLFRESTMNLLSLWRIHYKYWCSTSKYIQGYCGRSLKVFMRVYHEPFSPAFHLRRYAALICPFISDGINDTLSDAIKLGTVLSDSSDQTFDSSSLAPWVHIEDHH